MKKKLMVLAATLALAIAAAVPALGLQQGGPQDSTNVANAVNDCEQYFEQNQVAVQDVDQYSTQLAALEQYIDADIDIDAVQLAFADDGDASNAITVDVTGEQSVDQVGNVAAPVQYVNQDGAQEQYCAALADAYAFTLQDQNNRQ